MSSRIASKAALRAVAKQHATNPKRAALRLHKTKAHPQAKSAPRAAPAAATVSRGMPTAAVPKYDQKSIAAELAASLAARKPYTASQEAHLAIMDLYQGLGFSESAVAAVVAAAKNAGVGLTRVADDEFEKLPDSVPRPRGPSEFFHLIGKDGKKGYAVITSGTPYLFYADA